MGEALIVRIELDAGADADAEEIDEGARALSDELVSLDVEAVDRPAGAAPEGARAVEAIALGTLLVSLGPHVLEALTHTVASWIGRRAGRRVTLELDGDRIELAGASDETERDLVAAFIARHQ